jgi:hypothetical protein
MNSNSSIVTVQMSERRRQIVDEIKDFANGDGYTKGWDVVVETLSDGQIAVLTGKTADFAGAKKRVAKWVNLNAKFLQTLPENFFYIR